MMTLSMDPLIILWQEVIKIHHTVLYRFWVMTFSKILEKLLEKYCNAMNRILMQFAIKKDYVYVLFLNCTVWFFHWSSAIYSNPYKFVDQNWIDFE